MICELYGYAHKIAKQILKRSNALPDDIKMVSFDKSVFDKDEGCKITSGSSLFINEEKLQNSSDTITKNKVYPIENLVGSKFDANFPLSFENKKTKFHYARSLSEAFDKWSYFVSASEIPKGYRNGGCHYAGYIKECQQWCLPSWIWTNAAIVRYYCLNRELDKARKLGDNIISYQQKCGGWIVRNDYSKDGVIPVLAPNDSCYIALNCCLSLYDATNDKKYLDSAKYNAKWVIETARQDGLVFFGYDTKRNDWIKDRNIVDTGFTAGLFARLYEITGEEEYLQFLKRFVKAYLKVFYMPENHCFATAIDGNDVQHGGAFGRGQGWALEGLIPAYRVLKDQKIKQVIDETVQTLLRLQLKDGGWSYNLLKPLMGEDCKAVPVIAKCLVDWYSLSDKDIALLESAHRALNWCTRHTVINGEATGGIFSYTIEGAIAHHMYSNTAFVYGSSYASEVWILLENLKNNQWRTR